MPKKKGEIPPSIIRQPPPPLHHHRPLTAANKEEEEEECTGQMVGDKYDHLSRCKRKRIMNNQSLPDDMLFEILVHLRAQDIYDVTRLICRKWYNMIYTHNFIQAHLQHAPHGLLFHSCDVDSLYVTMQQGRVEIFKSTTFRRNAWSSCNGLILEFHFPSTVYVMNPITNQIFLLPPFNRTSTTGQIFIMAYVAACMEYKVVAACYPPEYETCMQCDILTVGVDKSWRTIRGPHLSYADRLAIGLGRPMMTQGFIHWVGAGDFILTMNVETEIITRHRRPNPQVRRPIDQSRLRDEGYGDLVTYLSTGGRLLSLLIACGELLWEVWEMEPESGEWRKLFEIDLEDDKWTLERLRRSECRKYKYLIPIAWLKYPQVLVFGLSVVPPPNFVLLYNLVDIFDKLDLPNVINSYHRVFLHQNSLVWLTGC